MWAFSCFCCYWRPLLFHNDLIGGMGLFWSSYICWGMSCDQLYGWFWRKYHEVLRKKYIFFCFRIKCSLYINLLNPIGLKLHFFPLCPCLVSAFLISSLRRVGCWSHPQLLCQVQCVIWALVKILWQIRVHLHLEHRFENFVL